MSGFPGSPRLVRGGLVVLDQDSGNVQRVITLQYNPDSLTRSLAIQAHGESSGDVTEALRLKGPAVETIKLEAELDATDYLEKPDEAPNVVKFGLHPQIATLEALANPTADHLAEVHGRAGWGTLEIVPFTAPLTLFAWGGNRVQPVRLTELSVTEEAFDPNLNPIRAKLSLGMRMLTVADVGFDNRFGTLFLTYLRSRETLARTLPSGSLSQLGLGAL
jgi:hypothetical protein